MDSLCYCYFSSFPCLPELLSITSMYFICYVLMDFIRLKQAFVCFHQNWFFFLHSHIILAKNRTALELMYSSLHGYPVLMALALLAQQWNKAWQSASAFTFFLFFAFFLLFAFFFFSNSPIAILFHILSLLCLLDTYQKKYSAACIIQRCSYPTLLKVGKVNYYKVVVAKGPQKCKPQTVIHFMHSF